MKKIALTLLVLLTLILTGCGTDKNTATTSDPNSASANGSPTKPPEETAATPTPNPEPTEAMETGFAAWGDRSIYAAGLLPEAQAILDQTPNASEYHITVNIPAVLPGLITGTLSVRYTNQETVPLNEVYFRLFAPVYSGGLDVSDVQVEGDTADTELENEGTALRVNLPDSLEVGESVVISMDYALTLPETLEGSYGLLGYFGDTLSLDTFYPMIPAYDEDYGWYSHVPYPNGDLTYQDMSYYQVIVHAPQSFVLAASGVEVDSKLSGGTQQISYVAGPARDFYISGSYDYTVESREVNGVTVNSYGKPSFGSSQIIALNAGVNAIERFNEILGEYPYTEFDIVNSPMLAYGVEYPGITNILDGLYEQALGEAPAGDNLTTLEVVIAHEVGHQWFYNMVGNDQQDHPWLDEATTQYITYLYVLDQWGEIAADQANISNWEYRMSRIENEEIPIGLAAWEYQGYEYSGIVYGRGPLFFLELEETYGQQIVVDALHEYYQAHLWGIGDEASLRASLEFSCACDLSTMFEEWIDE